jgi:tetratricopeptide (TPR) repeat protein
LDRCRADLTLLRKLDDINNFLWTWNYTEPGGGAPTGETIKARLRAALAGYGAVPRETPAAEAAERVKGSLVKERLLAALDWWLAVEQSAWEMLAGDPGSAWVREVLRSADPDPYRDLVRDAVLASDRRTMSALLDRQEALAQPARYAAILGAHEGVGAPARRRAILESALRDRPGDLSLLITLGRSYRPNPQDREGVRERVRWFQAAVVADPRSASAHIGLGTALYHKGDQDGAIAEFRKLVELLPNDPRGHLWLGDALEKSAGNKAYADEALIRLQKAVDLAPNSGPALISHAHSRLGYALQKRGDGDRAAINFREALRIDPRNARARGGLGVILFQKGEVDNAIAELRTAIGHSPNDAGLHGFLAFCLLRKRDSDGAAAEFETALRLDPDFPDAPTQLAWILATGPARLRDGKRAVELATRAGERTGWKDPNQFATLAAAYAEVKDFDRAVEYQEKALKSGLAKRGKAPYEQLELYKQKKPYRDPSLVRAETAPPPREAKP